MTSLSRREFVIASATLVVPAVARPRVTRARARSPHPSPRPGITAAKVMSASELSKHPKLGSLFESVRKVPQILDGIRCNCGCGNPPEMYSLLSCYEGPTPMALECAVCQGQGRLAARLHGEGKSLDQIRVAVDAKFG